MDWIESVFGISPDGGSGLTEFLFLLVPILVAIVGVMAVRMRHRTKNPR